jgi:hypothetical protein
MNSDSPSKSKCFRISDIPKKWTVDDLRRSLEKLDPSLRHLEYQLSLYPACYGFEQVALLNLPEPTKYFQQIVDYKPRSVRVEGQYLSIDCDFNGLTPLNDPKGKIIAE